MEVNEYNNVTESFGDLSQQQKAPVSRKEATLKVALKCGSETEVALVYLIGYFQ
jgi:hypothetical protein